MKIKYTNHIETDKGNIIEVYEDEIIGNGVLKVYEGGKDSPTYHAKDIYIDNYRGRVVFIDTETGEKRSRPIERVWSITIVNDDGEWY